MDDEEVPYRSPIDLADVTEDTKFSVDEEQQGALRRVHAILVESIAGLDQWHAFDLVESELKIKQQIKAHQLAAGVLAPVLEAVEQALMTVDEKFRQRNRK